MVSMLPLFARLTIDVSHEQVLETFRTESSRYVKAIVSREEDANRAHCHLFLMTTETNKKNANQNLKNFLKKSFPQLSGNKDYSITQVSTDYEKLKSYVVKEGTFSYYGFSDEEIKEIVDRSFSKPKIKESYKTEIEQLEKEFLDARYPIEEFIEKYFQIRIIKYQKPISTNQAEMYFDYMMSRASPWYLENKCRWHGERIRGWYAK